ncbi:MAG: hypothetical protein VXZ84_06830 [Planctomycetota bacterium]|nr:hypothetical protein [Planctomycetota bacterium]
MTVFEHIEKLKRDYTDKFVLVDDRCAELARFKGQTGRVKTVNMNGRALVEFDHYSNIGWFDIDVDFLKVIDRPPPKEKKPAKADRPAAKKSAAKSSPAAKAADKKLSPLEMARMQDSGAKPSGEPAASKEMSIAEKLAAARGNAGSTPAGKSQAAEVADEDEEDLAAIDADAAEADSMTDEATDEDTVTAEDAAVEAVDRENMSVDEMVAWCRKHDG